MDHLVVNKRRSVAQRPHRWPWLPYSEDRTEQPNVPDQKGVLPWEGIAGNQAGEGEGFLIHEAE